MIIDAHIHYGENDPDLLALMARFELKFLNICVAQDDHGAWRDQAELYGETARALPERHAWCTSFDLPRFDDPDYVDSVIAGLDQDFAAGAVACKAWKNIGMEVKSPDGSFFMIDDPLLDPIYEHIAASGKTLLKHMAEPLACWQPLDPDSPHYGYYSRNPQWHMYNKPEFPSHAELIAARDRMVDKHPNLRIVGAHLASLEYNVGEVMARLDWFPNFAVDISARLGDLAWQDTTKVRNFFIEYQDRILFGTDVVMRQRLADLTPEEKTRALMSLRRTYETHFSYLETTGYTDIRGREIKGLGLPDSVLDKIYYLNAETWYPGI